MKFAARDGSPTPTLAVTSPGWFRSSRAEVEAAPAVSAMPDRPGPVCSDSDDATQIFRKPVETASFVKGEEIFGPGGGRGSVYIVRSGYVRLYKTLPDGRSINLALLEPNTVFAQEDAYDGLATGSTAEALVDATVSIVDAEHLADVIAESPGLAAAMVHGMTRRLTELQTLAEHLLVRDTSVRLAATLLTLSRGFGQPLDDGLTAITLPLTHQHLANMIGSNRVTVTRKLLELQEKGAVRSLGRNSLAVDPRVLRAHAQAAAECKDRRVVA
ncbi:MAG: Crp/Fnr family transcriptional regulator [Thermomicrobiales bacterium]|nr:Crp/Fnr family transcriptional regulator [Thermomicrobiales bacterium]